MNYPPLDTGKDWFPMQPKLNLTDQRFGRLIAIKDVGLHPGGKHRLWLCQCDCGNTTTVKTELLRNQHVKSCGCISRPHGEGSRRAGTEAPEHYVWAAMRQRCLSPTHAAYPNYGGRGITICERWQTSYLAFLEDMGRRPSPDHSIDRIDNDGNYEPGNCRWATRLEQRANQRKRKAYSRRWKSKPTSVSQ